MTKLLPLLPKPLKCTEHPVCREIMHVDFHCRPCLFSEIVAYLLCSPIPRDKIIVQGHVHPHHAPSWISVITDYSLTRRIIQIMQGLYPGGIKQPDYPPRHISPYRTIIHNDDCCAPEHRDFLRVQIQVPPDRTFPLCWR